MRDVPTRGASNVDRENAAIRDLLHVFTAALLVFAYFSTLTAALGDGDTSWHLAAGEWIFAHREVPAVDPFSFTFPGKPWMAHEWLSEVIMYAAYSAGGWPGLLLVFGTVASATFITLTLYVRRWLSFPTGLIPVALCFAGTINHSLARPHLFGWLMLALWLTTLLQARDKNRSPPIWTALLLTLWANLHGSFVLGVALIGPFALEAIWEAAAKDRAHVLVQWIMFGLATLIASLITPYGLEGLIFPVKVSAMSTLTYIGEWKPTAFGEISAFELILLSGIFICLYKPVRMPMFRLLILIGLLHMALAHMRHQAVFLIVSSFLLARPVAMGLEADGRARPDRSNLSRLDLRRAWPILAVMAALVGGVATTSIHYRTVRPDNYRIPQAAIDHVPAQLRHQPVFNEYSFGGPLILSKIRVFIDGRADVYGDEFIDNYMKIANGDVGKWEAARKKWKFEWVIMPPDSALVAHLDRQPDWVRIYADKWAVIHELRAGASTSRQAPAAYKSNSPVATTTNRAAKAPH